MKNTSSLFYGLSFLVLFGSIGVGLYLNSCYWNSDSDDGPSELLYRYYNINMNKNITAFVLGGSGGVGSSVVRALAKDSRFEKVLLVGRRQLELPKSDENFNFNKFEQKILPDFDKILDSEASSSIFVGWDIGFYSLGVSSAKADEATYRKIEYGYTKAVAKYAQEGGCKHFHWVSGNGANKNSWFLFGRVKGQIEEELGQMGFPRVSIYRPAGILTSDNSGGMAGSTSVKALRFLDRCNKISVEAEMLGNVIVANTFRESGKPWEMFTNGEIVTIGRDLAK